MLYLLSQDIRKHPSKRYVWYVCLFSRIMHQCITHSSLIRYSILFSSSFILLDYSYDIILRPYHHTFASRWSRVSYLLMFVIISRCSHSYYLFVHTSHYYTNHTSASPVLLYAHLFVSYIVILDRMFLCLLSLVRFQSLRSSLCFTLISSILVILITYPRYRCSHPRVDPHLSIS